jgi:hypothetical protein
MNTKDPANPNRTDPEGRTKPTRTRFRELVLNLSLSLAVCVGLFVICELGLRWFAPIQTIVPASDWTPQYGVIAFADVEIVNAQPGVFRNIYTTNSARYRGPLVSPEDPGDKIVLLGDSNIFGFGVDDDKTIAARMNARLPEGTRAVNLGNGGWSLPQEVRRYLELGADLRPKAVVLHMASNDLEDPVYGICWVAYADATGELRLRDAPENPAGRLRKWMPPDRWLYGVVMSSQVMMRVKGLLNRYAMGVSTRPDGTAKPVDESREQELVPKDQVIVRTNRAENERRYVALLEAFAARLRRDGVRFVFLTDDENIYGAKTLSARVAALEEGGHLEHHRVSDWFVPGRDMPRSLQGHQWGDEAADLIAKRLVALLQR